MCLGGNLQRVRRSAAAFDKRPANNPAAGSATDESRGKRLDTLRGIRIPVPGVSYGQSALVDMLVSWGP